MVFTTPTFIIFMAIVFVLYYAIPKKMQWPLLFFASYIFYAFASPIYLVFLIATTVVTYVGGILMGDNYSKQAAYLETAGKDLQKSEKLAYKKSIQKKQKTILVLVIIIMLLMLSIFKYSTFLLSNFSGLFGVFGVNTSNFTLNIILPVGLSFYVFQSLGYCIDVYREMTAAEHSFLKYALYVSFFPQLLQGPIGDYNRLAPQLFTEHEFSYMNATYGLQRVAWGFFKKLVIANQISLIIDSIWASYESYSGLVFWGFILFLYSFQLYADFSGYMDIALGCAQMLDISLDENFETPYLSKNIAEFWRKWHITLGSWFKRYLFYPILRSKWCDGIRKENKKTHPYIANTIPNVLALFIVWFLIGLWHGADWSYVAYGLFHGFFIILSTILVPVYAKVDEMFPKKNTNKIYGLFQIARTFLIVTFGYVIFRPANLGITTEILHSMCTNLGIRETLSLGKANLKEFMAIFVGMFALILSDIWHYKSEGKSLRAVIGGMVTWKRWILYILLLLLIIFIGAYGESGLNQFAYFRF